MELRDRTKTRPFFIASIIACAVLQVALAPQFVLFGGRINFMLALAAVTALEGDPQRAVITGFCAGLFYDLTSSVPVGLMALVLCVASFVLASIAGPSAGGLSARSMQLVGVTSFGACLVYGIALAVMGAEGDILVALFGHGLTSAVLSALAAFALMLFQDRGDASHLGFSSRQHGTHRKRLR